MIKKMLYNLFKFIFLFIFFNTFTNKLVLGEEAYFDLSDNEIQIQTDFNGKEVIIFGLTDPELDTILTIKGPNKDTISPCFSIFRFTLFTLFFSLAIKLPFLISKYN